MHVLKNPATLSFKKICNDARSVAMFYCSVLILIYACSVLMYVLMHVKFWLYMIWLCMIWLCMFWYHVLIPCSDASCFGPMFWFSMFWTHVLIFHVLDPCSYFPCSGPMFWFLMFWTHVLIFHVQIFDILIFMFWFFLLCSDFYFFILIFFTPKE